MGQFTPEMFSSQERKIEKLIQTVRVHDKAINKLIDFLCEHVEGAESKLLDLRIDLDTW